MRREGRFLAAAIFAAAAFVAVLGMFINCARGEPLPCRDNLCGGDSYCSCSYPPDGPRCWGTTHRCQVDAACMDSKPDGGSAECIARVNVAEAPAAMPTWPDAGLALPDGGLLDVPVQLAPGQPAPFAGWLLSTARVDVLVKGEGPDPALVAAKEVAAAPPPPSSSSSCTILLGAGALFLGGVLLGYEISRL